MIIALWSRLVLAAFGIKLVTDFSKTNLIKNEAIKAKKIKAETALYVSNHISWLDILVIQSVAPVVFVAKSEIKSWPILGWLVTMADTCFINRSRRSTLLKVHSTLTTYLQAGQSICIFPEGTTTDGQQILPFHASLFQAAIDAGVVIQPIYLNYSHSAAAYVDNISLLASVRSVLLAPKLQITVVKLPVLPTILQTRQCLAIEAHQQVVGEYAKHINYVPD
ncbi:MAG: hypothetical protein RI956_187 [Pseudomonadota bacterium]